MKNSPSKPSSDQAKNDDHICLFCSQKIVVEKGRQGIVIALNENALQSHECPNVRYKKSQLKMLDYKENNENVSQTTSTDPDNPTCLNSYREM
jgi:hypothetical protein